MHAPPTFQVLGGLAAWRGTDEHGRPLLLELGGPKQRRVLAALLLSPRRPIPPARLIELVWGEDAPPSARASLQAYVSKLRTQLGGEALALQPGGYVLDVPMEAVDVVRWEREVDEGAALAAAGADAAAIRLLAAALEEWAPLLPELEDAPFVRGCVERVAARRRSAVELLASCRLRVGDVHAAAAELAAAVAEDPRAERLWVLLATARYRQGRPADALGTIHQARLALAEHCGLDAGPELRAVERAILANDPELGGPVPASTAGGPAEPAGAVPPLRNEASPRPRHAGGAGAGPRHRARATCRRSGTGTGRGARR